ncbi:MAG: ABC transporter permease, partial [Nitrospirota bacterium]|nr:ABC transporter permease [Nitrospirota bacterium]
MALSYEVFIGLRYLRARRKEGFISLITFISMAGVALGVTALIVVISVMAGFEEDLRNKIIGTSAHITVLKHGGEPVRDYRDVTTEISGVKGVVAATPFIMSQVMVTSAYNVSGIVLRGIDPATSSKVTDLGHNLKSGSLELLDKDDDEPGVIIGKELARSLGVMDGDMLTLISPMGSATPAGMIPRFKNFRVAGIFDSGFFEFDNSLAYVSIKQAQRFFSMGDVVTGIEVKV